jgi:hypothetical protein
MKWFVTRTSDNKPILETELCDGYSAVFANVCHMEDSFQRQAFTHSNSCDVMDGVCIQDRNPGCGIETAGRSR